MMNKIITTQIDVPTKTLTVTWTLESPLQSAIIDTAMNILADEIADEIDWEVLSKFIDTSNWTEIKFSKTANNAGKRVIKKWAKKNFKHGFFVFRNRVIFASEEHATLFALRWS